MAVSGLDGTFSLFDEKKNIKIWTVKCQCNNDYNKCNITCIAWIKKYNEIITCVYYTFFFFYNSIQFKWINYFYSGCDKGCLCIICPINGKILFSSSCFQEIIVISVSPTEDYIAVSDADNKIKIYEYPFLKQMFDILFYSRVEVIKCLP